MTKLWDMLHKQRYIPCTKLQKFVYIVLHFFVFFLWLRCISHSFLGKLAEMGTEDKEPKGPLAKAWGLLHSVVTNITIEPIFLLHGFAIAIQIIPTPQLYYEKTCKVFSLWFLFCFIFYTNNLTWNISVGWKCLVWQRYNLFRWNLWSSWQWGLRRWTGLCSKDRVFQ